MMNFSKYNSCGNDFIIIDDRKLTFPINGGKWTKYPSGRSTYGKFYIKELCDKKHGVGADGLILLWPPSKSSNYLYHMAYFNSDGRISSFCGNGSMCCAHFASSIGLAGNKDLCSGSFHNQEGVFSFSSNIISCKTKISLINVDNFQIDDGGVFINTGSPHYVVFKKQIKTLNVNKEGAKIRYSDKFKKDGVNVTFASYSNKKIHIRTYERGVESETLSCGTGAVAASLCSSIFGFI